MCDGFQRNLRQGKTIPSQRPRDIKRGVALMAAALCCAGMMHAALAACPDRYMRMVIPQPAGGVGDMIGRVLAEKVGESLKQQMLVENRPGATGTIGAALVAKAKPDGCTNLHLTVSGVVASVIRTNLPYDLERDFTPLAGVGSFPMVLAVSATTKIRSFTDFVAAAQLLDGVNYATGGPGTMAHLSSLQLLKQINGKGTHVPYQGNAPALQGLLSGQAHFMFPSTAEALPLVQGGKLRVLGVTSEKPLAGFPNVPTMKALGLADFSPVLWFAFLVPSATPAATVSQLQDAFANAVTNAVVQERLNVLGFTPEVKKSAEASAMIRAELARWKKVVQENNQTSQD